MTFIGVLVIISGILYIISGVIALFIAASGTGRRPTSNQRTRDPLGIAILLFGIIELAVARGLFRGNNVARIIVAIVNVLTIIGGLFAAFQPGNQRGTSFGQVVIAIIVLALLYSPRANEFFSRGGTSATPPLGRPLRYAASPRARHTYAGAGPRTALEPLDGAHDHVTTATTRTAATPPMTHGQGWSPNHASSTANPIVV